MKYFFSLICLALTVLNFHLDPLIAAAPKQSTTAVVETLVPPSRRYIATHNYNAIVAKFKSFGTKQVHFDLFEKLMNNETPGFVGYHGARRDFRIFQDIIRIAIEEILEIPIRPDFHFFRIPGDPIQEIGTARDFLKKYNYDIFDDIHVLGHQILSINIALYESYTDDANSTVFYFVKDFNWAKHSYDTKMITFFTLMGIDPVFVNQAFEIGRSILNESAVLIQLFDSSSNYEFLNDQSYLSHVAGRPYQTTKTPSQFILDNTISNFPQLRLIMDNRYALNPYSHLRVYRYDLNDAIKVNNYENKLRTFFQTVPVENSQKEIYRAQLLALWGRVK